MQVGSGGKFGEFGGRFVSETLMQALIELEEAFSRYFPDPEFQREWRSLLRDYGGRPTPLYYARNFSELVKLRVYLKREDLMCGGSFKLNNSIGQALLAKRMGKTRLITETSAGMHGISVAVAGNLFGFQTDVYMGIKDIERQRSNVNIMRLLGANIIPVTSGSGVLKDAVSECLRDWAATSRWTHYLIGSAIGPHPYPQMVGSFQSIIGEEIKSQILEKEGRLPDAIVACGSGGSNAVGAFRAFVDEPSVRLYFVEGGGESLTADNCAAAFVLGRPGVLHGAIVQVLQDEHGQIKPSKTRAAGLNYPGRGPEISYLVSKGRVKPCYAFDHEVYEAVKVMARTEGLIPALETAHAIAYVLNHVEEFDKGEVVVINYSGRGDKDLPTILRHFYGDKAQI